MTVEKSYDLDSPDYYFNRELSWLDFNRRVLDEANDNRNPLLERLNFLAIGSSNLDEFYMVRVAGLQEQFKLGYIILDTKTQLAPDEQLEAISEKNRENVAYQYTLLEKLQRELKQYQIYFKQIPDLTPQQREKVEVYFTDLVFPALTPLGVDAYRPFPQLNNKLLHIFVTLEKNGEENIAIVPVPPLMPRHFTLKENGDQIIILIEDIISEYMHTLFTGYRIRGSFPFRITRNADLEIHEEGADDLLTVIEDYLKRRKSGMAVRLEVDIRRENSYLEEQIASLLEELELTDRDLYRFEGPLDLTFLSALHSELKQAYPHLVYSPFTPVHPSELHGKDIYTVMEQQDVFVHHPFDSFDPIVDFVRDASRDANTLAIKQTLYRVSDDSPIVASLKEAAENGIQVTVLVELKARFDEERNVQWAKELEEAGANVIYGMTHLKTHSKITLVVKKKGSRILRYVHLGTGNYNDKTAHGYTDMGLFTTDSAIGEDATAFFNYLSGYSDIPDYNHLHVSPFDIRESIFEYIEEEMELHRQHGNGRIIAKMNSLTDKKVIKKLYEASQIGVKIDLLIRGICCLRPGVPGVSENIRVRSIVGRFLEHSRIYYFHLNGKQHLFLSSADLMTRNMVKRVEVEFPILDTKIRDEILSIFDVYLLDNTKARELHEDGIYRYVRNDRPPLSAQEHFMKLADREKEAIQEATRKKTSLSRFQKRR